MFELHLKRYFPNIKIIGEEDTSKEIIKESEYYKVDEMEDINFNLIQESLFSDESKKVDSDQLVFYIDPIDSTSSFIKKNFSPSTVMIGMTLNAVPFMGILHYFCWEGKNNKTKTIFNIPQQGIFEYDLDYDLMNEIKFVKKNSDDKLVIITSKTRTIPETAKCIKYISLKHL